MRIWIIAIAAAALLTANGPAAAWGDLGHEVTALIAYKHLTPKARAALDTLLASDADTLTAADFASRATWADKYRTTHPETAAWHFADIEIDTGDLSAACFGFPALGAAQLASQGPPQDCVLDKVEEFAAELGNPASAAAERLLALKFLIHFVGDLHQPLHSSDHNDRGGNCIGLSPPSPDGHETNLHAYWDVGTVNVLGTTPKQIAQKLNSGITALQAKNWAKGTTHTWAVAAFKISKRDAYKLPTLPTCAAPGSVALTAAYEAAANKDAALQLQKAGIRMAALLNKALGS
jgi:S1/P1 Nuclease